MTYKSIYNVYVCIYVFSWILFDILSLFSKLEIAHLLISEQTNNYSPTVYATDVFLLASVVHK